MRRHRNHIIAIVPWPCIPMRKDEEFSEWYNGVIERAELSDKRYPIKGMNVWRPYGWAIMKLIDQAMREEFDSTGHGEVNFPVLIPETEFQKEADHAPALPAVPDLAAPGLGQVPRRLLQPRHGHPPAFRPRGPGRDVPPVPRQLREGLRRHL